MPDYVVSDLKARGVAADQIELSWQPPPDVMAAIKYKITYQKNGGGGKSSSIDAGIDTTVLVEGLEPSTTYTLDVVVSTMLGATSTQKASITCGTGQGVPTGVVGDVACEFTSSAFSLKKGGAYDVAVKVMWAVPKGKPGAITGYVVRYREVDSDDTKSHTVDGSQTAETTISGLASHTSYMFNVVIRNEAGEGPPSKDVLLKTAEQAAGTKFQLNKTRSPSPSKSPAKTTVPVTKKMAAAPASAPAKPEPEAEHEEECEEERDFEDATSAARRASVMRQQERNQSEEWERGRTGTLDTSPFFRRDKSVKEPPKPQPSRLKQGKPVVGAAPTTPPPPAKEEPVPTPTSPVDAADSAEARREAEKRAMQEWERKRLTSHASSGSTATSEPAPAAKPAAAAAPGTPLPGGAGVSAAVAAARAASQAAEDMAERAREEEKRQMEMWEQKKLAAVRSSEKPTGSPGVQRRSMLAAAEPPKMTRKPSRIIGKVTTSESEVEANTPPLRRRGSKISGATITESVDDDLETDEPSGPGPVTLKRKKAEAKRQAEIDAAAAWELKHGTLKDARNSQLSQPSADNADPVAAGGADSEPDEGIPTAAAAAPAPEDASSLDPDEARRAAEKAQMEAWEARIGKGGKVQDLSLGVDSEPVRVPLKSDSRTSIGALTAEARERSSSMGGGLDTISRASRRGNGGDGRAATLGKGLSIDAGGLGSSFRSPQLGRSMRAQSFGDISRANNLSTKASPVGKAMVDFMAAETLEDMLVSFERCRELAKVEQTGGPGFFQEFKGKIHAKLDYKRGHLLRVISKKVRSFAQVDGVKSCAGLKAVIVGGGPVGLRQAIELSLLGCEVHIIEMRTTFTRFNILHLWDWVCHDLLELGISNSEILGKSFYHIGTKELQLMLTKLALCMGINVSSGVKFEKANKPTGPDKPWTISVSQDKTGIAPHCPKQLEANILIEAGGINAPVVQSLGFERKRVKMSTALGLVAHFEVSGGDRSMEEFSVSSQFKQKKFKEMRDAGLHLENCVYYQGATHYYVMTPTPQSLKAFGALGKVEKHPSDTVKSSNVDSAKLKEYARAVATSFGLPAGTPFIKSSSAAQLFDFSSRSLCKTSCKVLDDKKGKQLLVLVIGDALIEPFWPEGLGLNRGFLSALDSAYIVQEYFSTGTVNKEGTKKMLKSRDKLFSLMRVLSGHTKKEVLREGFRSYSLHPNSRYLKWKTGY
mmetsp:Transcript_28477/g.85348  ORF Transcript_28477/g.85348 Transcript_28477/m.85348 type:complete len:1216 (-) Transcript_28477:1615-5262(-)